MKPIHRQLVCWALVVGLTCGPVTAHAGWCDRLQGVGGRLAGATATLATTLGGALKAAGVSAVAHSSGAMIASTASGGYVAGTLGAIGTATAVMTAPVTIAAGGTALVVGGAAVLYCRR